MQAEHERPLSGFEIRKIHFIGPHYVRCHRSLRLRTMHQVVRDRLKIDQSLRLL
jgi:hypothetical protein